MGAPTILAVLLCLQGGDQPPPPAPPAAAPAAPAAPAPPAEPQLVWVFIDRLHEFGGELVREDNDTLVLRNGSEERTFQRSQIRGAVDLVPAPGGKPGMVQMRDGSTIRASIFTDDLDGVGYEAAGIRMHAPRSKVYRVVMEPPFEERYAALKEAISPGDLMGRYVLCAWLVQQEKWELAREELRALLAEGDHESAHDLLRRVEAQLALKPAPRPPDEGPTVRPPPRAPDPALPQRLLTDDEVNLIRVYELDFEKPPRVKVDRATVEELMTKYASSDLIPATGEGRTRLLTADPLDIVRLMFALRAREFYPRIEVDGDPVALSRFRRNVHDAWLIPSCASSKCHGGVDAGRFFLHQKDSRDERVRTTNLLILLESAYEKGPLVDFEDPRMSLLIQYALPRHLARQPHPEAKGWKPALPPTAPRLLEETERWIRSMQQPRPDYPVDFEPPKLDAPDAADLGEPNADTARPPR